jgi:hypothetical protein
MRAFLLSLVDEVARERFVEGVEQSEDDNPEDDLCGNAFAADDFFVEGFVLLAHAEAPDGAEVMVAELLDADSRKRCQVPSKKMRMMRQPSVVCHLSGLWDAR